MEKSPNFLSIFLCLLLFFSPFIQSSSSSPAVGDKIKQVAKRGVFSKAFDPTRVTQLSWRPRAFLYKGFLSDKECDHLIDLAKGKLQKSLVADEKSGENEESEFRTSTGMFLSKAQDEIVDGIEERIAAWTLLPVENGEPLQILHYGLGQKYEPHFDFFDEETYSNSCGNRFATVLMYLSNISKGGETVFPMAKVSQPKDDSWSGCARRSGYAVRPEKGDALLFFSLHPNATIDPMSLHGSCPVIEGEKWSATKWIHVRSLHMFGRPLFKEDCVDENEMCRYWAKIGECDKNPLYMVGSDKLPGNCRKSCDVCSSKD